MKESEKSLSIGQEIDERRSRKIEIKKEIDQLLESIHELRKQKIHQEVYKAQIEKWEQEVKLLEEELALLEQVKY
jgi:hypothetical protein